MNLATLRIATRFCGPPGSGNGGYVAGLMAGYAPDTVEVRLRAPVPLDQALPLLATPDGGLELRAGERAIATAAPLDLDLEVPPAVPFAAAVEAAARWRGAREHVSPGCFVCGPGRRDGLGLTPGPLEHGGRACVAAPWQPDPSLAGTRGRVRPEFLWAALDCPGYFAVIPDARTLLVGSFCCRVDETLAVGEPSVVVGWSLGSRGRTHRAATALYGEDGRCVARATALWIEPRAG
ncbi:MAG: hypothetical protein JSR73_15460 [Proteobacteria bacterium]|nr:hypothetical protein [Pseudomonadota bacterium]